MFASTWLRLGLALLALLAPLPAAVAQDVSFTGLVTYTERMLLPANSALSITLVSLPEQAPIVTATAMLPDRAGSPVQFTLDVRSTVLVADRQYGLVAQLAISGGGFFANIDPVLVDPAEPDGNVIEVRYSAPAPSAPPPVATLPVEPVEPANPLLDTAWRVIGIGGDPVLADTEVTLSIAADHRAGGKGGCNSYFTEASFDDRLPLAFGPVAGTRMACRPDTMAQEASLFAALAAVADYQLAGNSLALTDASGVPLVELVRQQ